MLERSFHNNTVPGQASRRQFTNIKCHFKPVTDIDHGTAVCEADTLSIKLPHVQPGLCMTGRTSIPKTGFLMMQIT